MAADELSSCTTESALVRCTFEDSREVVFVDSTPRSLMLSMENTAGVNG